MATKISIYWRLGDIITGQVHPPLEYVIHQDQVRAQSEMDQCRLTQDFEPPLIRKMPENLHKSSRHDTSTTHLEEACTRS